jgi:RNA polymerase sigma-70 factor, ECF subfamily
MKPVICAERFAAEALPHLGDLYPAALRVAGDPADAQELVTEAYARAYASLGQRGDASTKAWLYRSMADVAAEENLQADGVQADGVQADAGPPPPVPAAPGTGRPAGDADLGDVPAAAVRDALEHVPARSRLAIYLADVEGFSIPKIARILRLPAAMVASRMRRGRRQLRASLQDRASSSARTGSRRRATRPSRPSRAG